MSETAVVRQAVQMLERALRRPGMYFGPTNVDAVLHWLNGFNAGCHIAGINITYVPGSIFHQIVEERGWEFQATKPWRQMRERGWTDETIVQELLTIEIETWKRTYQITNI
jgi:hypothetical protein